MLWYKNLILVKEAAQTFFDSRNVFKETPFELTVQQYLKKQVLFLPLARRAHLPLQGWCWVTLYRVKLHLHAQSMK